LEKLDMRKFTSILILTALSPLALSTLPVTAWAEDGDSVKTQRAPYKPGRQIDDSASAESSGTTQATPPAYDGSQTVRPGRAPHKPGREADDQQDKGAATGNDADERPNK
jgi:hypothetical protein